MSKGASGASTAADVLRGAEAAREAWKLFYDLHRPSGVNGTEAFAEASSRLDLISICLDRVLVSHACLEEHWQQGDDLDLYHINLIVGPLRLDTESFYWQCGRFRNLAKRLPGLTSFEAPGIRDVRNHLIEHPEGGASRVLLSSSGWHPERGPVIKGARIAGTSEAFPDAGLLANAGSFYQELHRKLTAALHSAQSPFAE